MVRQPREGFRSGLDAVFLAAACQARDGDRVLEAGCGAGAASLCLLARAPQAKLTGVEIDPDLAALARENAEANGVSDRFEIVCADVTAPWTRLEALGLVRESYDHVIANPPFFSQARTRPAKTPGADLARAMPEGKLEAWVRFLAAAAKPSGRCAVIHTVQALPQLLASFERRFGGLRIAPLYPRADAPAIRVIVSGVKGSRAPLSLAPGVILHEKDGSSTPAAKAILREGCALKDTVGE